MTPVAGSVRGEKFIVGSNQRKEIDLAKGNKLQVDGRQKGGDVRIATDSFAVDFNISPKEKIH